MWSTKASKKQTIEGYSPHTPLPHRFPAGPKGGSKLCPSLADNGMKHETLLGVLLPIDERNFNFYYSFTVWLMMELSPFFSIHCFPFLITEPACHTHTHLRFTTTKPEDPFIAAGCKNELQVHISVLTERLALRFSSTFHPHWKQEVEVCGSACHCIVVPLPIIPPFPPYLLYRARHY